MSAISTERRAAVKDYESRPRSGYMTTTEVARLCGVSRFTIINWAKQGRIKTIRTVGRHYRIPASEALSLLRSCGQKKEASPSGLGEHCRQQTPTTNGDEERGNCLTSDEKDKQAGTKKRNFLYFFGYGAGRGVHGLKEKVVGLKGKLAGRSRINTRKVKPRCSG